MTESRKLDKIDLQFILREGEGYKPLFNYGTSFFATLSEKVTRKVTGNQNDTLDTLLDQRLVDGLVDGLVESQVKILDLVRNNPMLSKSQLSKEIGISTTAIDKNISHLKKKGLLKRIGPAKGGHWVVTHD